MNRLYKPYVVVIMSVAISVTIYLTISAIIDIPAFDIGLVLSIGIPMAVSLPISVVMLNYLKKIELQKIELEKLNSTNKKLFSLLSHDIRSPMLSLKGMVDIVISGHLSMEDSKVHFEKLSTNINNVLKFLNDLLEWSQKQAENKILDCTLLKCEEIIMSTTELLDEVRNAKNIQLELGDMQNTVYANRDSYALALRNIFHNAIKFTPKNGKIEIYTEQKGDEVHTVIQDSGAGVSKENIEKILNEGKWFTQKGTSGELGTGFGISTCIEYLKKNNGELLIESELNHGTKISIVLPNTSTGFTSMD